MVALLAPERIEPPDHTHGVPGEAGRVFDHAERLADSGMFEEALRVYKEALLLRPLDHYVLNNTGVALAQLGRHQEALEMFEKAFSEEKWNPVVWRNLTLSLLDLGRQRDAASFLRDLPDNDRVTELRGQLSKLFLRRLAKRGIITMGRGKPSVPDVVVSPTHGPPISDYIVQERAQLRGPA